MGIIFTCREKQFARPQVGGNYFSSSASEQGDPFYLQMCGGYQLMIDPDRLQQVHAGIQWRVGHKGRHVARNSVRPTNFAPVLVRAQKNDGKISGDAPVSCIEIAMMKWGLVPSWGQERNSSVLINARRETISELPTFAGALKARESRRCVVVSTGFYEWEKGLTKSARKTPYLINLGDPQETQPLLFMAGIYEVWTPPGHDEPVQTFVICTTAASEQFSWLHSRLPCILATEQNVADWLDVDGIPGPEAADKLLNTLHSGLVWRQMSQHLERAVSAPRSRNVKLDVKKYFVTKNTDETKATPFTQSVARVGRSEVTSLNKLGTPIKKSARGLTRASPSVKRENIGTEFTKAAPTKGQRKITSFFGKKT